MDDRAALIAAARSVAERLGVRRLSLAAFRRASRIRESRTAQIGNSESQENQPPHPAFLQNRLLPHRQSGHEVDDVPILHGEAGRRRAF